MFNKFSLALTLSLLLLVSTVKVFSDDFEKYEKRINRITLKCISPSDLAATFGTDGKDLFLYNTLIPMGTETETKGNTLDDSVQKTTTTVKKKKGGNVFIYRHKGARYDRHGKLLDHPLLGVPEWGEEIYINFDTGKVIKNDKELGCRFDS